MNRTKKYIRDRLNALEKEKIAATTMNIDGYKTETDKTDRKFFPKLFFFLCVCVSVWCGYPISRPSFENGSWQVISYPPWYYPWGRGDGSTGIFDRDGINRMQMVMGKLFSSTDRNFPFHLQNDFFFSLSFCIRVIHLSYLEILLNITQFGR